MSVLCISARFGTITEQIILVFGDFGQLTDVITSLNVCATAASTSAN